MNKSIFLSGALALALSAATACSQQAPAERAETEPAPAAHPSVEAAPMEQAENAMKPASAYDLYVDENGAISLPENFALDWAHLGSWAVAEDGDVAGMHNVYAPKSDIEYYREHGEFPDGAMMVKEVRGARGAAHTTGDAHWVEDVQVWFMMIKDTQGRFPDNPLWAEGWGWALFNGDNPGVQVATDFKKDCRDCHVPAQETDWTYVYAYPALGAEAVASAPAREAALDTAEGGMTSMASAEEAGISGEDVFVRCQACHSLTQGQHGVGPSLAGVFGRKAGAAEGFAFSPAMANANITWTAQTMDAHLINVDGLIPGNRMAQVFPAGIPNAEEREALISYLMEATAN